MSGKNEENSIQFISFSNENGRLRKLIAKNKNPLKEKKRNNRNTLEMHPVSFFKLGMSSTLLAPREFESNIVRRFVKTVHAIRKYP